MLGGHGERLVLALGGHDERLAFVVVYLYDAMSLRKLAMVSFPGE